MGCGTSKPANVVSPVPNTQTAFPKGNKDSLPAKPQRPKSVDTNVVTPAGRQDTQRPHKPLKENTTINQTVDPKVDQFVRNNSVKVGSQVVAHTSSNTCPKSNESNQEHDAVLPKPQSDAIPLKEDKVVLTSGNVRNDEDSGEIPRGSATPSDHDATHTKSTSSEAKAVLTETPHETTTPIPKRSSPKLTQEEPKADVIETPTTTLTSQTYHQPKFITDIPPAKIIEVPRQTVDIENGQQDHVTKEILQGSQLSVTMETDRGNSQESQSSFTIETDRENINEVVTIRIEVDDELEPELQNETLPRVSVKQCCAGHESSLSQLDAACAFKTTCSSGRHFSTKSDCTIGSSNLAIPNVSIVVMSASDSPSLNRIEKHMNEELDVYPTLRPVSPSLAAVRSAMSTSLTDLKEEEEDDDDWCSTVVKQATTETPSEENENHQPVKAGYKNAAEAHVDQNLNTTDTTDNLVHSNKLDSNIQDGVTASHNKQGGDHQYSNKVADAEIVPNENPQTQTVSNEKGTSDTGKEYGHVTEETADQIENRNGDESSRIERKTDEPIAKENGIPASHVSVVEQSVGHTTTQDNTTANQDNICGINNDTVDSTNKRISINPTSDLLSESVEINEIKETVPQTGSKDDSSENQPIGSEGSNDKLNGSKTDQVNERLTGNKNNIDEAVETFQDQINPTLPDPDAQRKLTVALRFACKALPWEHIRDQASEGVTSLSISRSLLSQECSVGDLVQRLVNLRELDLSNNLLGPQGFRVVCLGVAKNKTLTSLNLSNNLSDTDSSKALGIMLSRNYCLEFLDVSGNDLGQDYFSRCVGPALQGNNTLKTLKCASCGATDLVAIMDSLASQDGNRSLVELDVSNNQLGVEFGKQIGSILKTPDCNLRHVDVHGTDLHEDGMHGLLDGIQNNSSLVEINAGGHNVRSLSFLMVFVYSCVVHPSLQKLTLDNTKPSEIDQWDTKAVAHLSKPISSSITHLSLAGCSLTDDAFESLAMETEGLLSNLSSMSLSGSGNLTVKGLESLCKMIRKGGSTECPLSSLDFSLNEANGISNFIASNNFLKNLKSLSLRKAKISPTELMKLHKYLIKDATTGNNVTITSLILDQIKLSGTNFLQGMLGLSEDFKPMLPCALTSLSLSGCSLNDKDVKPLMVAITKGLELEHISLSANRLTDTSVDWLVDSLDEPCSLCHLDMSNNKIRNNSAEKLASVLEDGKLPNLSTLLLSNNNIGAAGIIALVSKVSPNGTLHSLNLKDQQQPVGEEDMDKILETVAMSCDIPLSEATTASTRYLDFSPQAFISLTGLGGEPGDNGPLLDSIAIQTDYFRKHKRTLSLQDALSLSAVLTNPDARGMSKEEWDLIISADKDAPAWLQVPAHRKQAIYISNLPLTATREKLDSLLENDADCNLKEVFLLKDPILRKPNGLAWALFNDEESVQKAMEFYHSGQAQIYGRPFVMSSINVNIVEHDGKVTEDEARKEMAAREDLRKAEESEKAAIVQAKFEESSARHEYAAQHPAYADGRIW